MEMDLSQAYATIGTDLLGALSLVLVGVAGLVIVVWDSLRNDDPIIPWLAAVALAGGLAWEIAHLTAPSTTVFYDLMRVGGFASFLNVIILGSALFSVILSVPYFKRIDRSYGEIYALIM